MSEVAPEANNASSGASGAEADDASIGASGAEDDDASNGVSGVEDDDASSGASGAEDHDTLGAAVLDMPNTSNNSPTIITPFSKTSFNAIISPS